MKVKLNITIALISILIVLISGNVYAADEFSVKIHATNQTVMAGENIVLHVALEDINVEDGLGTLCGKLQYDSNVFDRIESDSFLTNDKWDSIIYNSKNGSFITVTATGDNIKENIVVFDLKLKVLNSSKLGDTTISISQIGSSDGNRDIETKDAKITLTVEKAINNSSGNSINSVIIAIAIITVLIIITVVFIKRKK